ncbi:MAG: gliding motility protein GldN [Ekhidna sp.]|nr:gliding motility protein GldN [Ekhidna sp.]
MKRSGNVIVFLLVAFVGSTQTKELAPLVKPEVNENQVMFKKTIWRRMDMNEKQNRPFFSKNGEIARLLIEAVDEGLLTPYRSDSCISFMPDIIFSSNVSVERANNPFVGGGFTSGGFDDSFDDDSSTQSDESDTPGNGTKLESIPPELFTSLWIREELIFDRNRSRMYYYIRSLTIYLPKNAGTLYNPGGFEKKIASFKYDDVVELFRGPYSDRAIYYNQYNSGQYMNMSDAFELRLFRAPIIRISNPDNLDIREIYAEELAINPLKAIIIQQQYEYDLMEYESELWEY